jgi:hypothetical protein
MEVRGQLHISAVLSSENNSGKHRIGGYVDFGVDLGNLEDREISCPYRDSNPE